MRNGTMKRINMRITAVMLVLLMTAAMLPQAVLPAYAWPGGDEISRIMLRMSADEKISQLIIPAIRTWKGPSDTKPSELKDLDSAPELREALRKHQYGGIILFANNVESVPQLAKLVTDLQQNNAAVRASTNIPYLMPADEEGGVVVRLTMGTRMTGSMAVGATGANAEANAELTGRILGEEMASLGLNTDFAPDTDVNSNPANPVIGVRSFSDDPETVARLGMAFSRGLSQSNVIAAFKHFPGHGDTGTDSHTDLPSVDKTYDEISRNELVPFREAIAGGADMIMTAHITFPKIDEEHLFADGTKGCYPATMSPRMVNGVLRGDLGFRGVVITDALEMDAIADGAFVPGEKGSSEYAANIAEKVILSGTDMLLIPTDLDDISKADFYDDYINRLISKYRSSLKFRSRINESVRRVLKLKKKYGILDLDVNAMDAGAIAENAKQIVGSDSHHAAEADIARQAVTLVKNDDMTLPLSGYDRNIVMLYRSPSDLELFRYAIKELQKEGLIDADAYVEDLNRGRLSGSESSRTRITLDYNYDTSADKPHYTAETKKAVSEADTVIAMFSMWSAGSLKEDNAPMIALSEAMADVKKAGGRFVLLSANLPYDAARFQSADAIAMSYMTSGTSMDPTDRGSEESGNAGAYNANIPAALSVMFDSSAPAGRLPVNIPELRVKTDGSIEYLSSILYPRGSGEEYKYAFTEGAGQTVSKASSGDASFRTNARRDRLVRLELDGRTLAASEYELSSGHTGIRLKASLLETLKEGRHSLKAVYDYGGGEFGPAAEFTVTEAPAPSDDEGDSASGGGRADARISFIPLRARAAKTAKRSVTLRWSRVKGADSYVIYAGRCSSKGKKYSFVKAGSVGASLSTGFRVSKLYGKKLRKGTYYRFRVAALDSSGREIARSQLIHAATAGGRAGNCGRVTTAAKKGGVTIRTGKTFRLKAKEVSASAKKRVSRHTGMRYESTNASVAAVNSKGVIKGAAKGSCYVYAYAQNGVFCRVRVTVK